MSAKFILPLAAALALSAGSAFAHPHVVSMEVASLCPNADITVFPWREPPELKARTIEKIRRVLRAHRPIRAGEAVHAGA